MKRILMAVILMLSLSSLACAADGDNMVENEPAQDISDTVVDIEPARNLSTSVDEFCWKYFATLNRDKNIFYSPYGINAALSILANGASGDTRTEILHALEADNVENLNDCHKSFSGLAKATYQGDNLFIESNLLLIDKKIIGQGLDKNFKRVVSNVYKSDVREADFSRNLNGEKKNISNWVSDKTNGFIPNYKSIVTADTMTDLLNVVYFKGKWAMPFDAIDTYKATFTNRDGSTVNIDMMNKDFERKIAYHEDDKFKAIALPYSAGATMYLIMPIDDGDLNIAEAWNNETFDYRADFLKGLSNAGNFNGKVVVRLPKFELDIENNLVDSLKAIGIKKSFTDAAEFFNIVNDTSLKIENAQHRAKVKVDELGTEAAAITDIRMNCTAIPPQFQPQKVYFLAERPFLFMIRDVESDVILFAGVVNNL